MAAIDENRCSEESKRKGCVNIKIFEDELNMSMKKKMAPNTCSIHKAISETNKQANVTAPTHFRNSA